MLALAERYVLGPFLRFWNGLTIYQLNRISFWMGVLALPLIVVAIFNLDHVSRAMLIVGPYVTALVLTRLNMKCPRCGFYTYAKRRVLFGVSYAHGSYANKSCSVCQLDFRTAHFSDR